MSSLVHKLFILRNGTFLAQIRISRTPKQVSNCTIGWRIKSSYLRNNYPQSELANANSN